MRRLAWGLLIVWAGVYVASFIIPFSYEATGDGFTRGLNRVGAFFGWQTAAGLLAVWLWPLSRHLGADKATRWLGRVPVILAATLVILCVAAILWARFGKPPASDYVPPNSPVTEPTD